MSRAVTGWTGFGAELRSRPERLRLERIASSLTERDQKICLDLYEHVILTTPQIGELHFGSYTRSRTRMLQLYQLGLVRRTRPRMRPGSLPHHYLLDRLGAYVVAEHKGIEVSELGFQPDRAIGIIDSQRLRHLRETNGFFTRLAWACRRHGDFELARWWSERRCYARWKGQLTPDAFAELAGPKGSISFFLELDRGTENRARLEQKLARYQYWVTDNKDSPQVLLFCFHSPAREQSARAVLAGSGLVVATTSIDRHAADPLSAAWRPIGSDQRVPLIELPRSIHGGPA